MIAIDSLGHWDIGREVIYHREHCERQTGTLTSWNPRFVFVRFNGPNGEACEPEDVSFALRETAAGKEGATGCRR